MPKAMASHKRPAEMDIHEWLNWYNARPEIKAMHEAMAKAE